MKRRKLSWIVDENNCFVCNSHAPERKGRKSDKCEYIRIHDCGIRKKIHRFIYEQCFGEIPDGFIVRHKCNNTLCINPEHLDIGTHGDNMRDRDDSGRTANGTRTGTSKLSERDVAEIRRSNNKIMDLCKAYSVSKQTIMSVRKHRTYKDVSNHKETVWRLNE